MNKCKICKKESKLQSYSRGQYYWEVCDSCLKDINSLNLVLINNKWVKYTELTDKGVHPEKYKYVY